MNYYCIDLLIGGKEALYKRMFTLSEHSGDVKDWINTEVVVVLTASYHHHNTLLLMIHPPHCRSPSITNIISLYMNPHRVMRADISCPIR